MKSTKIIILLFLLAPLSLIPYIVSKKHAPDAELANIEPFLGGFLDYVSPIETSLLTPSRFSKESLILQDNNNKKYTLSYEWNEPKRPYPENIKFPLIVHLYDTQINNDTRDKADTLPHISYSAEYITQPSVTMKFPAFNFVPSISHDEIWGYHKETSKKQTTAYITKSIEILISKYPIDKERVYIVGCGLEATGVFSALKNSPNLYAAAIAHSGEWDINKTKEISNAPLYIMTGENNKRFPPSITRTVAKNIKNNGGNVIYKEIASMPHDCSYKGLYSNKVWSWLFSNKAITKI